jgi:NAD(P)H-hydrate epimerase
MVIDADAIRPFRNAEVKGGIKGIITPHVGEFKELTGIGLPKENEERCNIVKEWAKKFGMTILLKGAIDIISDGERVKMNRVHNVGMTVGGTGDVLSGIVGALLSKGVEPFNAARMGAFINGMGGNLAFEEKSYGMVATDIIDKIPKVLKKYL